MPSVFRRDNLACIALQRGRLLTLCLLVLGLCGFAGAPARAAVTATFYSHVFRLMDRMQTDFPHGFVVLAGTTEDGQPVNLHLGFSAKNIFINVLWQPVDGALDDEGLTDAYVSDSISHFSVTLTDAQYHAVMTVEHAWRTWPQPSYDMDTHNCVIFVKEMAVASGLSVSNSKKFIHAPGDFLEDVAARNAQLVGRAPQSISVPVAVTGATLEDRLTKAQSDLAAAKAHNTQ